MKKVVLGLFMAMAASESFGFCELLDEQYVAAGDRKPLEIDLHVQPDWAFRYEIEFDHSLADLDLYLVKYLDTDVKVDESTSTGNHESVYFQNDD